MPPTVPCRARTNGEPRAKNKRKMVTAEVNRVPETLINGRSLRRGLSYPAPQPKRTEDHATQAGSRTHHDADENQRQSGSQGNSAMTRRCCSLVFSFDSQIDASFRSTQVLPATPVRSAAGQPGMRGLHTILCVSNMRNRQLKGEYGTVPENVLRPNCPLLQRHDAFSDC